MNPARRIAAVGCFLTALAALLVLYPPQFLRYLDGKAFDTYLRLGAHTPPSGEVVVVEVDDASLARFGQWPWPRYRLAMLAGKLVALNPKVVALDFTFAEPDRTSLAALKNEMSRDLGVTLPIAGLDPMLADNDEAFAEALAGGPFILGYQFLFDRDAGGDCVLHPLAALGRGGQPPELFEARGAVCNLTRFSRSAAGSGFLNVSPDSDGILRRVPLVISYKGGAYPSLALAAAMKARGVTHVETQTGSAGLEYVTFGERKIPVDERGQLLINYRGPRNSLPRVSALDVLEGRCPPEAVAGKVVLLGSNAHGLIDVRSTPLDPVIAGTEIQATVADNLLGGDPLHTPSWAKAITLLLVILAGAAATWSCASALPLWPLGLMVLGTVAINAVSAQALWRYNMFVSPVLPSAALWTTFTVLIALRTFIAELTVKERNKKLLVTQDALIQSMATMVEKRHHGTGGHIQRTRAYVRALAVRLKANPAYTGVLDDAYIDLLYRLAPMHDIGKVGIPDRVLLKRAGLSTDEFEEMKRHTVYGAETIEEAQRIIGEESYLSVAHDFAIAHQEWWDGSGYPKGLKGEEIPLAGRLMAVADVYDALRSEREYKPTFPHEQAVSMIRQGRGTHFDPAIVDAFVEIHEQFREIAANQGE